MNQVIDSIHALGRVSRSVSGFSGPYLGPKQSDKTERNFNEEQYKQSETMIPKISQGSHGNANASGMFDNSRNIIRGPQKK